MLTLQAVFKLLDMQKHEKQNLREAMLLHKDVSRQLANYCQAAAHVLRMAQPRVTHSSAFPDDVQVQHSYHTLRLLAAIRRNALMLLAADEKYAAAYDVASEDCVLCQAQMSELLESLQPEKRIAV